MKRLACILAGWFVSHSGIVGAEEGRFEKGAVASVHPLATQAGVDAMKRGGNAVDAAIATALTLGVVDGHNSGIGGGCFIVLRAANGDLECIDGREMAPATAHRDMFIINGKLDDEASKTGPSRLWRSRRSEGL